MKAATSLILLLLMGSCAGMGSPTAQPTATPLPPDMGTVINVLDENGKPLLDGVVVRITNSSESDDDDNGELRLSSCLPGHFIAAWAPGYQAGFIPCDSLNYTIMLQPLYSETHPELNVQDNPNYFWRSARTCEECHSGRFGDGYQEYTEWAASAHARVFTYDYFETMYRGTDLNGVSGSVTTRDLRDGNLVRHPDQTRGPGFQLDFPAQTGNCAFCHAPAAIQPSQTSVDLAPLLMSGGDSRSEGITCDICHKVNSVNLSQDGYPFADKPGILSFELLRTDGLRVGPFSNVLIEDVTTQSHFIGDVRETCSSVFGSSEFCAACHYGKFGNVLIYSSYQEWRNSSYGDNPKSNRYRTCQDCHMSHMDPEDKRSDSRACAETAQGFQSFSHNMMDIGTESGFSYEIPRLIRGAATLDVQFDYEPEKSDSVQVKVTVINEKAGHKLPTDSPLRHLLLVVDGQDQFSHALLQLDGSQIPNWGGTNSPYLGTEHVKAYAGLPGKIYANILMEKDTNISPSAAYWNEVKPALVTKDGIASDNRIPPGGEDRSSYSFTVPEDGEIRFMVSLIYRFGFYDLMQQKKWVDTWQRWDIPVVVMQCAGNIKTDPKIQCKQIDPPEN